MKFKNKLEEVVLNEQLLDEELEQLKGGITTVYASGSEEVPVDRGTSHCCNW